MKVVYGKLAKPSRYGDLGYWEYFDARMVEHTEIPQGGTILDLGTGPGWVLAWAIRAAGDAGFGIGVDIDWFGEQFIEYFPEYVADWEHRERRPFKIYRESTAGYEMILLQAGFTEINVFTETEDFVSADAEEWWGQVWGAYWWPHIDPITRSNPDKLTRFKEDIFTVLESMKKSDEIHASKTVVFAFGTRPGTASSSYSMQGG